MSITRSGTVAIKEGRFVREYDNFSGDATGGDLIWNRYIPKGIRFKWCRLDTVVINTGVIDYWQVHIKAPGDNPAVFIAPEYRTVNGGNNRIYEYYDLTKALSSLPASDGTYRFCVVTANNSGISWIISLYGEVEDIGAARDKQLPKIQHSIGMPLPSIRKTFHRLPTPVMVPGRTVSLEDISSKLTSPLSIFSLGQGRAAGRRFYALARKSRGIV